MFGLSKKERYEKKVEAALIALLCDFSTIGNGKLVPSMKKIYDRHWDGIIQDAINLNHSPNLTAYIVTIIFYQDIIYNQCSVENLQKMRNFIINKTYSSDDMLDIIFRLQFTTAVASAWAGKEIDEDLFVLGIRDIHRAIFDGSDDKLEDTTTYLIEGGKIIKRKIRGDIPI